MNISYREDMKIHFIQCPQHARETSGHNTNKILLSSISITRSNKYEAERNVLKEEYRAMLRARRDTSAYQTERIIKAANGHPDLESTQAEGVWLWQWALTGNLRKTVCR